MYNSQATGSTLTNVTITANSGGSGAGGVEVNNATLSLVNDTIDNNTASAIGGVLVDNGGKINLENTIIAGNHAPPGRTSMTTPASGRSPRRAATSSATLPAPPSWRWPAIRWAAPAPPAR